jgi:hypothetical protein
MALGVPPDAVSLWCTHLERMSLIEYSVMGARGTFKKSDADDRIRIDSGAVSSFR